MADNFEGQSPGLASPAENGASVTPSDTVDLTTAARALWVGGAGTVKVYTTKGATLTFVGLSAGTLLPVRVRRVYSTGTTATSILALW